MKKIQPDPVQSKMKLCVRTRQRVGTRCPQSGICTSAGMKNFRQSDTSVNNSRR